MKLNKLDKQYQIKKFFKVLFEDIIGEGNNLVDNQFIRLYQNDKSNIITENVSEINRVKFFNNLDNLVNYCGDSCYELNTYFNLAATNGESGQEKDLRTRTVLGFDFDKKELGKDFTHTDIIFKFKELGLWYHALIDSGNGYHAYVCINPTLDHRKAEEVTKAIGVKLGADTNAMKVTQLLRVPYTFNIKDKPKQVNIIKLFDKDTVKRYDIDKLYHSYCNSVKDKQALGNKATYFILNNGNLPNCIQEILKSGSPDGSKSMDLQKIIVALKRINKSFNEIGHICKEWNDKSGDKYSENELNYQAKYIFDNINQCSYNCKGCEYNEKCFKKVESDFNYSDDEEVIDIEYKVAKKLKFSKRGVSMNGNELLIFNVLKHWEKELNIDDIIKYLTYKKRCALSEKTIRTALTELEEKKIIIRTKGIKKQGIKDTFKINTVKCNIENVFSISYFPTLICIYGLITPGELRLYHHMRYKHDLEVKGSNTGGNVFTISQTTLADDLGTDQSNISKMIKNLIETKILEIWEISKNEKGLDYYTYRLVK